MNEYFIRHKLLVIYRRISLMKPFGLFLVLFPHIVVHVEQFYGPSRLIALLFCRVLLCVVLLSRPDNLSDLVSQLLL
jgi:hypothetical protein